MRRYRQNPKSTSDRPPAGASRRVADQPLSVPRQSVNAGLTAQDRLVKQLRLAKVSTMEAANAFLENEYWPEWNERFARPVKDFLNQHRTLSPSQDLAAILCHVEERVIANDYTFSFAARRY